jgi:peptide/nickel transport system substrate-binding protein
VAGEMQRLLLEETPLIISYCPDLLVPIRKDVIGLPPIAAGLLLDRVYRSPAALAAPTRHTEPG